MTWVLPLNYSRSTRFDSMIVIKDALKEGHASTATRKAYLLDNLHLSVEPCCSALNQRHIGSQAHSINMSPGVEVVKRIENDIEGRKPVHIELSVLDVCMVRFQLCTRLKLMSHFLGNL